jgi:hypothetical protein
MIAHIHQRYTISEVSKTTLSTTIAYVTQVKPRKTPTDLRDVKAAPRNYLAAKWDVILITNGEFAAMWKEALVTCFAKNYKIRFERGGGNHVNVS